MGFNCTSCGLCCRSVGKVLAIKEEHIYSDLLKEFPYKADETGACEKLDKETNQCSVYETRPDVCRVDKTYERLFAHHLTREQYYRVSEKACKVLQDQAALVGT